jgi:hypothetical protein
LVIEDNELKVYLENLLDIASIEKKLQKRRFVHEIMESHSLVCAGYDRSRSLLQELITTKRVKALLI